MTSLMPHLKSMPKALAALTGIFAACSLFLFMLALLPSTWRIGDGILAVTTGALMLLLAASFYTAQRWARYAIPLALAGNTVYLAIRPWPNEGSHQWLGSFFLAIPCCWYFLFKKTVLDYFGQRRSAELGAAPNGGPAERLGNSGVGGGPPSVS
jgi:hypothetical protein